MLKRIKYVSRQVQPMSGVQVDALVEAAAAANARAQITGALVVAGPVFFQIIEGPPANIDALFAKIRADVRHTDVVCLATEEQREIRLFPYWSMREVVHPSSASTARMRALVYELSVSAEDMRASLTEELAALMRAALRRPSHARAA